MWDTSPAQPFDIITNAGQNPVLYVSSMPLTTELTSLAETGVLWGIDVARLSDSVGRNNRNAGRTQTQSTSFSAGPSSKNVRSTTQIDFLLSSDKESTQYGQLFWLPAPAHHHRSRFVIIFKTHIHRVTRSKTTCNTNKW